MEYFYLFILAYLIPIVLCLHSCYVFYLNRTNYLKSLLVDLILTFLPLINLVISFTIVKEMMRKYR